jgi:hypothetical protein
MPLTFTFTFTLYVYLYPCLYLYLYNCLCLYIYICLYPLPFPLYILISFTSTLFHIPNNSASSCMTSFSTSLVLLQHLVSTPSLIGVDSGYLYNQMSELVLDILPFSNHSTYLTKPWYLITQSEDPF